MYCDDKDAACGAEHMIHVGRAIRSCISSLRLVREPDKAGKIPSLLHRYEGVLP